MNIRQWAVQTLRLLADVYRRFSPIRRGQVWLRLRIARWEKRTPGLPPEKMLVRNGSISLALWISPSSTLGSCVWALGSFDRAGVTECMELMASEPGGTLLDIGANVGLFSLFPAVHGRDLRVIAVEAHPEALRLLHRNVAENAAALDARGARVEVVSAALGASDGAANFLASFDDTASSLHHFPHLKGHTVTVNMRRGDSIVAQFGLDRIALCKLDVEGAELLVLQGLQETLQRQAIRHLRLEINRRYCAAAGHTPEDMIVLLAGHGYAMTAESRARYEREGWQCEDFMFAPGSK